MAGNYAPENTRHTRAQNITPDRLARGARAYARAKHHAGPIGKGCPCLASDSHSAHGLQGGEVQVDPNNHTHGRLV